ncbi:MAG: hypothetical protein H7Y13_10695 [Sphingobacteriaceae bacterium]|nr:hypothetical protein [Sphingobacteriaceae bacterium]
MKIFSLLATILLPFALAAQSNYQPGFVVKADGDTLHGLIDQREWRLSPKKISFKRNTNEDSETFGPENISSLVLNNTLKFISYSGTLSADKNSPPDLPYGLDTTTVQGSIFLEELSTGTNLTFYRQSDITKERYFIQEKNSKPVELIFRQYTTDIGIATDHPYKRKLAVYIYKYASNDHTLLKKLESLQFNADDLIPIIREINQQKKKGHRSTMTSSWFAGAGLNRSSTGFKELSNKFSSTDVPNYSPKLTMGIDVYNNPQIRKLILRGELTASYFSSELRTSEFSHFKFSQITGSLVPQIIYNIYNTSNFSFYLGPGLGMHLTRYFNTRYWNDKNEVSMPAEFKNLNEIWVNVPIKAGVFIKKRYEISCAYSSSKFSRAPFTSKTATVSFNYLFGEQNRLRNSQ